MNGPAHHFRNNLDAIVVFGFAIAVFALAGLNWQGIREFSSVVSVVCLMVLLWRVVGDLKKLTPLSLLLSASLSVNLGTGAVAQYLLSQTSPNTEEAASATTLGFSLVLISRLFVLFIVVTWDWWIRAEKESLL